MIMKGPPAKCIPAVLLYLPVIATMLVIITSLDTDTPFASAAVNPYMDPCPDLRVKSITVQGVEEGMVDEGSTYHIVVMVENIGNATLPEWWEMEVTEFIDVVFYQLVQSPLEVNETMTFEFDVKVDNLGDWGLEVKLKTPLEIVEKDTSNNRSSVHYTVREEGSEGSYLFQFVCCAFWLIIVGIPLGTVLTGYIILGRKSRNKNDMVSYVKMIWDPTQGP